MATTTTEFQVLLLETNEEYSTSDPGRRVIREVHNCPDAERAVWMVDFIMQCGLQPGWWIEVHRA